MARGDFNTILADCLERMARGESSDACLARYPHYAAELEPMLTAAGALKQLGNFRLPGRAREQGRLRMRRALVEANRRPRAPWGAAWVRGLAGALALLVLVAALANLVRASQPGDWAYPYRISAERLPARMAAQPAHRAAAELRVAEQRLADAARAVSNGQDVGQPLQALLISDSAAVEAANSLSVSEQQAIAAHLSSHAEALEGMASSAVGGATQAALAGAAQQIRRLAAGLAPDPPLPSARPTLTPTDDRVIAPTVEDTRSAPPPTATVTRTMQRAAATPTTDRPEPTRTKPTPVVSPIASATRAPGDTTRTPDVLRQTETPRTGETKTPEPGATKTPGDSSGPGSGGSTPRPTDDHGGSGGGSTPRPTDDHGGSGSGSTPQPTDDHSGSGGGGN